MSSSALLCERISSVRLEKPVRQFLREEKEKRGHPAEQLRKIAPAEALDAEIGAGPRGVIARQIDERAGGPKEIAARKHGRWCGR